MEEERGVFHALRIINILQMLGRLAVCIKQRLYHSYLVTPIDKFAIAVT